MVAHADIYQALQHRFNTLELVSIAHPDNAHAFINYILRPEVHAAIAEATGYGTPNAAAQRVQQNPIPFPTGDELARLEYQHDLGRETATWDQIWTEIKSA